MRDYIFIKKGVRSFIEVRHYCWLCSRLYLYYVYVCGYTAFLFLFWNLVFLFLFWNLCSRLYLYYVYVCGYTAFLFLFWNLVFTHASMFSRENSFRYSPLLLSEFLVESIISVFPNLSNHISISTPPLVALTEFFPANAGKYVHLLPWNFSSRSLR